MALPSLARKPGLVIVDEAMMQAATAAVDAEPRIDELMTFKAAVDPITGVGDGQIVTATPSGLVKYRQAYYDVANPTYDLALDGTTDDSAALQALENTAATNGARLSFPTAKIYLGNGATGVSKSPFTMWDGVGLGEIPGTTGTRWRTGTTLVYDGDGVAVDIQNTTAPGQSIFARYGGIRNMTINGPFPTGDTYGVRVGSTVRVQQFENLYINGFVRGFHATGAGELFCRNVFISNCKWSFWLSAIADSHFYGCSGGSGPNANAAASGGNGWYVIDSGNTAFTECRFQVQLGGSGGLFTNCDGLRFVAPIADQNATHGLQFTDCTNISISDPDAFNNGTSGSNGAGILIFSTATGVSEHFSIIGGNSRQDDGTSIGPGLLQTRGVHFGKASGGEIHDVRLIGVGLDQVSEPISGAGAVDTGLRVTDCPGVPGISSDNGDGGKVLYTGFHAVTQRWNTPLTANRSSTLRSEGAYDGAEFLLVRQAGATGAFDLSFGSTVTLDAASQWARVVHDGSSWHLVQRGTLA